MQQPSVTLALMVCGLEELNLHGQRGVTHVLSILDPTWPDPADFQDYNEHHRVVLRFHDAIEPGANVILPERTHVEEVMALGRDLAAAGDRTASHLLVHCHAGISRSTAAMTAIMAQMSPDETADALFGRLVGIRSKAWPNSRMIAFADDLLGRGGELTAGVARLYRRQLEVFPHIRTFMCENNRAREVAMADAAS